MQDSVMPGARALAVSCLLCGTLTTLQPAAADWQGDLEAGTELRDGDVSTRLRGTLFENSRPFTQSLYAEWVLGSRGGNAYRFGYLPRFWLTKRVYGLGEVRARVDEPLGVDREIRALVGAGAELLVRQGSALTIEAGVGAVATHFSAAIEDDESSYLMVRGLGYHTLAERVRIDANASVERSARVTDLVAEVGIAFSLATGSVRYAVQTRRIDIDGLGSADTTTGYLSFGYRF